MASNARTLEQLVEFVTGEGASNMDNTEMLPTAALLTGINQPDHLKQFETLTQRLHAEQAARVCVLQSRDCATLKAAVESMVYSLMDDQSELVDPEDAEDERERDRKRLRRTQCTMKQLNAWYANNFGDVDKRRALVIILPDFECFNASVLQDFILILSAQTGRLPFVLVLGVATAMTAVHGTLPYHVSSKIKLRVFQTQPAPTGLNEVRTYLEFHAAINFYMLYFFFLAARPGAAIAQVCLPFVRQGFQVSDPHISLL